jgi:putative endonuclease
MNPVRASHYVYILQNNKGQFYSGCTINLKKRVQEHKSGKSKYTRSRGPYSLIYYEYCLNKNDAYRRERYLKTGMGKRYLKNRLKLFLEEGALTG